MLAAPLLVLALAGPSAPAIEWSAPTGCPDDAEILGLAARLMGRATLDEPATALAIRGRIQPEPAGFALAIEIESPSGVTRKQVRAESCAVLGRVAALMVAVALDPLRTTTAAPIGSPTPSLEPVAPAAPTPSSTRSRARASADLPAEPTPAGREPRFVEGALRAAGAVGGGLLPTLDVMLSLGGSVRLRRLRVELVALHGLSRVARYPDRPTVGAEVAAWGGSLRAGPVFERGAFEASLRAGLSAAVLVAQGFGVDDPRPGASTWVALSFVPGLRWRPGRRWAVGADLEADMALRRPGFSLDVLPALHRASPVSVRGAIVVELRLGVRRS
jgi:hypothetical protein